jgi:hypothetical protein
MQLEWVTDAAFAFSRQPDELFGYVLLPSIWRP